MHQGAKMDPLIQARIQLLQNIQQLRPRVQLPTDPLPLVQLPANPLSALAAVNGFNNLLNLNRLAVRPSMALSLPSPFGGPAEWLLAGGLFGGPTLPATQLNSTLLHKALTNQIASAAGKQLVSNNTTINANTNNDDQRATELNNKANAPLLNRPITPIQSEPRKELNPKEQLKFGIKALLEDMMDDKKTSADETPLNNQLFDVPAELVVLKRDNTETDQPESEFRVVCRAPSITVGKRWGPFQGQLPTLQFMEQRSVFIKMMENLLQTNESNSHLLSNAWMAFVEPADRSNQHNVVIVQIRDQIFYETCRPVVRGDQLTTCYGQNGVGLVKTPATTETNSKPISETAGLNSNAAKPAEHNPSNGFPCDRCGKLFTYPYYRDKHVKYTRCVDLGDRKFPCQLCPRSFEKRDRLRIHVLHVHEKHRPHQCAICQKSFSQSSSLNKHMRVHSGERPYKCVYCSKAFTASSILRTHIRQHSGEKPFKCKHCGKSFASHAAHDSHVRRTHNGQSLYECRICGKSFQRAAQLSRHVSTHC